MAAAAIVLGMGLGAAPASGSAPSIAPSSPTPVRPEPTQHPSHPDAVTGLAVSAVTAHSVGLSWNAASRRPADTLMIRRGTGVDQLRSPADGVLVASVDSQKTTYVDTGLQPNTSYHYAVFAVRDRKDVSTAATTAAKTGSGNTATGVSGQVTDAAGHPLNAVRVFVTSGDEYAALGSTGANGQYAVTGLSAGTFTVCFLSTQQTTGRSPTGYFGSCYLNKPFSYYGDGTPVTVRPGKVTRGISGVLPVGGAISGRVTGADDQPLAGVEVAVWGGSGPGGFPFSAVTSADGTYRVIGLESADYNVCFNPRNVTGPSPTGYLYSCLADDLYQQPGPVDVTAGSTTTGVDISLAIGGAISGTVTDDAGSAVAGIAVSSFGSGLGFGATTDAAGQFLIRGMPGGTYAVCFEGAGIATAGAPYGYSGDCVGEFDLGGVTVTTGETSPLDGYVHVAGAIGGRITAPNGSPVADIGVWAYNPDDPNGGAGGSTDADGRYQIVGLAPGDWQVCFDASQAVDDYVSDCYENAPPDSPGQSVTVVGAQLTTATETLQPGVAISGTVTGTNGEPLGSVSVVLESSEDNEIGRTFTQSDGTYQARGLMQGTYGICFDTWSVEGSAPYGYVPECYDQQPRHDPPTSIVVGPGGAVGIDASLAEAGAISGTVTDTSGTPLEGATVYATSPDSPYASTNSDGTYQLTGLAAGDVSVCFAGYGIVGGSPTGYVNSCHTGEVTVTSGHETTGVDGQLQPAGAIAGRVTNGDGGGLGSVWVAVLDADGNWVGTGAVTDDDGSYVAGGLPTGTYTVCFYPWGDYLSECYANPVTATASQTTSGIDAVLTGTG
jgi:protocatechuate 3,4-dioxygenase beta subunit